MFCSSSNVASAFFFKAVCVFNLSDSALADGYHDALGVPYTCLAPGIYPLICSPCAIRDDLDDELRSM